MLTVIQKTAFKVFIYNFTSTFNLKQLVFGLSLVAAVIVVSDTHLAHGTVLILLISEQSQKCIN